jgi:uncharacterized protein (DUF1501 family)
MNLSRRQLLGLLAAQSGAIGGLAGLPLMAGAQSPTKAQNNDRILVVLELSGGNDGLNTVVPYGDDAYYRYRPKIGIRPDKLRKLDQRFGLNPGMSGFERLWKNGQLAIVHGCGYDKPSYSHFTSMAFLHTAAPNSGDDYGWYGRLADAMAPKPMPNFLVNIDTEQSLAVRSRIHTPVVFDAPERFARNGYAQTRELLEGVAVNEGGNANLAYLNNVAAGARESSTLVRTAWTNFKTPIDYGIVPVQMPKVAACIAAGLPTRLYYAAYRYNAFDTHVQQNDLHQRLLSYVSDSVDGFLRDMERLGFADRVVVMVFSEFGRRVPENTSLGTDHGTSNVMFFAGKPVRGGHYGGVPDLSQLVDGENLPLTTDFRRVYATAIDGWLRAGVADTVLKGKFEPFAVF